MALCPGLPGRERICDLDFTEERDSEWQWHQLDHMQVCTSLQTDNHAAPHHSVFTGWMLFLPPNGPTNSVKALKAKAVQQLPVNKQCSRGPHN